MNEIAVAEGVPDTVREILFGSLPDYVSIHTRSGQVYKAGTYINTVYGQKVNCIDTLKKNVSNGPLVYLEQCRIYPNGSTTVRTVGIIKSMITHISYHGNIQKVYSQQFF